MYRGEDFKVRVNIVKIFDKDPCHNNMNKEKLFYFTHCKFSKLYLILSFSTQDNNELRTLFV